MIFKLCAAILTAVTLLTSGAAAVNLQHCGPDQPLEAIENRAYDVTCDDINLSLTNTVIWEWRTANGSTYRRQCSVTNVTVCERAGDGASPLVRGSDSSQLEIRNVSRDMFGNATVWCWALGAGDAGNSSDNCQMDVIHPADVTSCGVQTVRRMGEWRGEGGGNITTVYSSMERYRCQLLLQQGSSNLTVDDQEYTTSRDPSSLYESGTCNYSTQLRVTSATYRYFVVITPGAVSASAGSITVERPTGEPTVTCDTSDGMWVVEGQDITCSCNVSSLGQPAGRLVGYINTTDGSVNHVTTGDYGASEVKLISGDITRQAGEVVVTCRLEWVTPLSPDLTASVSISVAYGPDDVTIKDPGELYVNPNVATTVEFTCNTSSSKPQVSVTWSGPPCAGQTGSTCRVTLTPDHHLNNITCNATNSITQVARSALRTLSLKYPPPSRPTITGYEGQPLYTGQSLEMTCTVNGGRPSVSGVTFTCDGQGQEVTGQSSIIRLTRLTSSDHGKKCTCSARWGDDSHHAWYNVTSTITLTVYYPPSGVNISYGSQTYPFMVGEIVTLECHAETMGNPPVTLTLQPEGQETGAKSTLTLGPLTVDHNGQNVVCEATNNYTQWSNQPLVERFRLNVYYRPVISLSRLHQDQCRFPVDDDTVCILTEGQRVNLRCEAHGNPGPLNITWSQTTSDVLDVQVDRDTPTAHRCDVNTARVTGDNRLPLNTSLVLTVLVTYEGDLSTLTANQHTSSLTIMESQSVNVTCSATGRPTPAVRLSRLIHTHVTSRPPGNVTVDDKVSLTYADNKVTCDKAGLYVCEVTFHQGRRETRNLTLFVNCSPRVADGSRLPQHLTVSTHPLNVSFSVIAYPPPHVHVQLVKDSAGSTLPQPVQPASVKVMCVTSQLVYLSVCTISVMEAIASHAGFYRVTLNNTLDTLQLSFYLNFTERISAQQDDEGGFGAGATVGVSVLLVIGVVVVVVVLVVCKTRAIERCTVFVNIRRRITRQKSQTADIQLDTTTPETDAHVYANYVGGRPRNADGGKKRYKGDGTRDEPDDLHDYQNMAPDQDTGSSNYYDRMLHTQDDIDAYQEIHVYANTGDRADDAAYVNMSSSRAGNLNPPRAVNERQLQKELKSVIKKLSPSS